MKAVLLVSILSCVFGITKAQNQHVSGVLGSGTYHVTDSRWNRQDRSDMVNHQRFGWQDGDGSWQMREFYGNNRGFGRAFPGFF